MQLLTLYDIGLVNFLMSATLPELQTWYATEFDTEYADQMLQIAQDRNTAFFIANCN